VKKTSTNAATIFRLSRIAGATCEHIHENGHSIETRFEARVLQLVYGRWAQLSVNATVYLKKGRFRLSRLAAYESCTY